MQNNCLSKRRQLTVDRVATANLPTRVGNFKIAGYRSLISSEEFVVLFKGEMNPDIPTLVRIHSQCLTGDVFWFCKMRLWTSIEACNGND
jgi:3,4-dihydroxy 2-butanone 4-phosphate synthase / GTP cyclohydrolase II